MVPLANIFFWLSLATLVATKVMDFVTTIRHVGPEAESNPFARLGIQRWGFRPALATLAVVWTGIVVVTYVSAWWQGGTAWRLATACLGFIVSWAQWDAARFNRSARASWFTRVALRGHTVLHRLIRSRLESSSSGRKRE